MATAMETVAAGQCQSALSCELNKKSCGIGTWFLRVHRPVIHSYEYQWQGKPQKGHKLTCLLISPDSNEYCAGVAKIKKNNMVDLTALKNKFFHGSTWAFAKIQLGDDKKEYLSSSCKVVVDLRASKSQAML